MLLLFIQRVELIEPNGVVVHECVNSLAILTGEVVSLVINCATAAHKTHATVNLLVGLQQKDCTAYN